MKKSTTKIIPVILLLAMLVVGCSDHNSELNADANFEEGFVNPPNSAKPRVWWHWMNGNITKEGIQKDLEWMDRIGIGGFQNFDANLFTPVVVPEKLVFMTPAWKDAFKFTTTLANEKGLEMAIAGSPGWSVTGGPWVAPEDAMKKYVWSEVLVEGGTTFNDKLPRPADNIGPYQEAPLAEGGLSGGFIGEQPHYYQDALVVAYRLTENEKHLKELNPKMSVSGGDFDPKGLLDHDISKTYFIPPMEVGKDMWIQYAFDAPQTFKAFGISGASFTALSQFNGVPLNRSLKVSDDGINFRTVATLSGSIVPYNTIAILPTTAKYWRMCFETLPPAVNPFAAMSGAPMVAAKPDGVNVAEFVLFNTSRIDQAEDKAGFTPWRETGDLGTNGNDGTTDAIASENVFDLTSKIGSDGSLNWEVPEGKWIILRLGYALTGRQNHPASPEATGLEVDKLDKEAVKRYINTYLDMYQDATGGLMGEKGLGYMILDSYEAGHMNWSHDFPIEFETRRGYSLVQWLPVLTGRIVNSLEASEKFLWDFRKTIGELIVENHYDLIGEELHKRGMKRYTESHEDKRVYLADGMDVKRNADIPMAAIWTPGGLSPGVDEDVRHEADIRESASVANIYGKPFVAAESMTSIGRPFQEYPERLKRTADLELASGLNRFVIHTSVHQPLDDKKPGFSLGPFGQYFTRQETWAEQAKPWIDYLARSSHVLQQGRNVADILYYFGENTNVTWEFRNGLPAIPKGFEFDFVNATALIEAIEAQDGKLVAKSGNSYEVLMLDENVKLMTFPVLEKLGALAHSGIKIIGKKPIATPSLSDDDNAFSTLADNIWALPNVGSDVKLDVLPDVEITGTDHKILFRHRNAGNTGIYWLNNRSVDGTEATVSFRGSGKTPKLWNPMTGKIENVSYEFKEGRTIIPLNFESWDAYFIIFGEKTRTASYVKPHPTKTKLEVLEGSWKVNFNTGNATPLNTTLDSLISWSDHGTADVKYFSGTGSYTKTLRIEEDWLNNDAHIWLDLGEVKNLAEVIVNGKSVATLWKTPFRIDITPALIPGQNQLEIKVTNLWVNRLVGDAQPDVKKKTTFTTMPFYNKDSPLLPSGLLGPVTLFSVSEH